MRSVLLRCAVMAVIVTALGGCRFLNCGGPNGCFGSPWTVRHAAPRPGQVVAPQPQLAQAAPETVPGRRAPR